MQRCELAFTRTDRRAQRLSDGTVVIETRRFEVPNRYRHLERVQVRYASWDLTQVHLVDEHTDQVLCRLFPQDKTPTPAACVGRSSRWLHRRRPTRPAAVKPATGIAPLLAKLMTQQAPPGYRPPICPKMIYPTDEGENP